MKLDGSRLITGFVRPGYVLEDGSLLPPRRGEPNSTLYGWASIHGQLLRKAPDGRDYSISGMYLEFENNGGAAVTPPSFDRSGGKSYFDGLSASPTKDYLRVAMTAATFESTDESLFPDGNLLTFIAQSAGVVGVHGKTYSHTASSRVFGGALVAMPGGIEDPSRDIVHSRFYFTDSDNQLIKTVGRQVYLTWPLTLH